MLLILFWGHKKSYKGKPLQLIIRGISKRLFLFLFALQRKYTSRHFADDVDQF
jgi:hypothetical protein